MGAGGGRRRLGRGDVSRKGIICHTGGAGGGGRDGDGNHRDAEGGNRETDTATLGNEEGEPSRKWLGRDFHLKGDGMGKKMRRIATARRRGDERRAEMKRVKQEERKAAFMDAWAARTMQSKSSSEIQRQGTG